MSNVSGSVSFKQTLGKPFAEHDPLSFKAYVEGLYHKRTESKAATSPIADIILYLDKKPIVKCKRVPKAITMAEVKILAEHHFKSVDELLELFIKRKFKIKD